MIIRGTPKGIRTPVSGVKGRQLGQLVHGSIPLDSLYSDAQHYPTVSIELLLELMVRLELTAY